VNSQTLEDENVGLSKWRSQASRGREDGKNSGKREREGQSFEVWECQLEDVMTCRCGPFPICETPDVLGGVETDSGGGPGACACTSRLSLGSPRIAHGTRKMRGKIFLNRRLLVLAPSRQEYSLRDLSQAGITQPHIDLHNCQKRYNLHMRAIPQSTPVNTPTPLRITQTRS
jgi:hypothetical protein